jgi:MYXO-CTERM domain-containing protein
MPMWILFLVSNPDPVAAQPHVDGMIEAQIEHGSPPDWLIGHLPATPGSAAVVIVLHQAATAGELARLEALGVAIERVDNRPLVFGRVVSATVDRVALARLRTARFVDRVLLAPAAGRPALDRSRELLHLPGHGIENAARERLTGAGVVIADIDTLADVFHPDFFFADAGWYSWIDVNGDGVFTPGTDAVDLDADGVAGANETGELVRAATLDPTRPGEAPIRSADFEPALDWIYADENENDLRDEGPASGFTDATPAFGEPLFVPDDVDGDGLLEPAERLVRLGTSKLRKVLVEVMGVAGRHVFERGIDLSAIRRDYTHGIYGYADALHGSAVLGILAGGVPLPSRRFVGIAPDAELLLAWTLTRDQSASAVWALGEAPDVMCFELGTWSGIALDGSDAGSAVIDEAAAAGIAAACAVGNIGGARKHALLSLPPEGSIVFPFEVLEGTRRLTLTLHVRGASTVAARVLTPGGASVAIDPGVRAGRLGDGMGYELAFRHTDRDTAVLTLAIFDTGGGGTDPLTAGGWSIEVDGDGVDHDVHAFLSDSESGVGAGAAFDPAIATDASTIQLPAVADGCLRVGAMPAHLESEGAYYRGGPEAAGEVRAFSGRGPRIDGVLGVHVLAPDNPWAPTPAGELYPGTPGGPIATPGAYRTFSGTSGAAPHAAGVLALLAQNGVRGADAHRAIREGADGAGLEVPNDDYGHGRLDAAGALGQTISGSPPTISLSTSAAAPGDTVTITATIADPDGGALEVRWDESYDGTWDGEYGSALARDVVQTEEGARLKARVRDPEGYVAEAAILVALVPAIDAGIPDAGAGPNPSEADGCACSAGQPSATALIAVALVMLVRARRRKTTTRG